MPLQVDDVELLFAGLTPLNAVIPQPALRFSSQLGEYGPGEYIRGWEKHKVSQIQSTTKMFGPGNFLGADQIAVVGEIGATNVWDFPDASQLRYEGEGTDTAAVMPSIRATCAIRQTAGGFPTAFSWGYRSSGTRRTWRLRRLHQPGTAHRLQPRRQRYHPRSRRQLPWRRKSGTLGVEASYMQRWSLDLSYTIFRAASLTTRSTTAISTRSWPNTRSGSQPRGVHT